MIAVDTSIFVDYQQERGGQDIELLRTSLSQGEAYFPPVVVTELLSAPRLAVHQRAIILSLPRLEIDDRYWARAGDLRMKLAVKKLKAKLADALIAQSCLDHDMPLLTRDEDFRHFAKHCGLKLLK